MKDKMQSFSTFRLIRQLLADTSEVAERDDVGKLLKIYRDAGNEGRIPAPVNGINPLHRSLHTAITLCEMVSPDRNMVIATLLYELCATGSITADDAGKLWDEDVARLLNGLLKVTSLYGKHSAVKTDNFRHLLMAFAEDIRVIIIMIVDRLCLMRLINHHPDEKFVADTAFEASYLYAPLAHRLGLYKIKGDLEDLSLKYTSRDTYTKIARELN